MNERQWLATRFEAHRSHLRRMAYRMLGSTNEADDALQESWLRVSRSDARGVDNLGGWLTTVVGRVCLDMLRARKQRREEPLSAIDPDGAGEEMSAADLEQDALIADSVGLALLVVLETLTPAERVAYVLHHMFDLPFDEIAPIVGRSVEATRQLASRAQRRVRDGRKSPNPDRGRQREIVEAFMMAARNGDFDALIAVLDPNVVLRVDEVVARAEAAIEIRGASVVAKRALTFSGRATATRLVFVNGVPGAAWFQQGRPAIVFVFTADEHRILEIELIAHPERLRGLDLASLDGDRI